MKLIRTLLLSLGLLAAGASCAQEQAQTEHPFDYWLLALSWSPQFCAETSSGGFGFNDRADSRQCSSNYAFIVHGLWPQFEEGYPSACDTSERVDSALTDRMSPLMPDPQLVKHQWRQHGACSGMAMKDYFLRIESVYRNFVVPETFRETRTAINTTVLDVKREFMNANPKLNEDQLVLLCSGRFLREVRVCYDHQFKFRNCGEDVVDRCRQSEIQLRARR